MDGAVTGEDSHSRSHSLPSQTEGDAEQGWLGRPTPRASVSWAPVCTDPLSL